MYQECTNEDELGVHVEVICEVDGYINLKTWDIERLICYRSVIVQMMEWDLTKIAFILTEDFYNAGDNLHFLPHTHNSPSAIFIKYVK